jgi:hypothetical protein
MSSFQIIGSLTQRRKDAKVQSVLFFFAPSRLCVKRISGSVATQRLFEAVGL